MIVSDSTYHTSSSTLKSGGTTRWTGPELLDPDRFGRGDGRMTKESDCYALGMVVLEVLSGKPPFPGDSNLIVITKVINGEHPEKPQGKEEVRFTDDLWKILEQCWLPRPERRPAIDAVLQCLERGSTTWQPLPSDSDGHTQSDSDDQLDFTSSHDSSIDSSMFLDVVVNLTHPQPPLQWTGYIHRMMTELQSHPRFGLVVCTQAKFHTDRLWWANGGWSIYP